MTKPLPYKRLAIAALLLLCMAQGPVHGGCGTISPTGTAYGPYDYRDYNARARYLRIVELHHFTPDIENLMGSTKYLADDISYTLNKFPNHDRALDAISRLAMRDNTPHPVGSDYSVDCWFQRAVVFRPRDGRVRMMYGIHLERLGQPEQAIEHMVAALRLEPGDVRIQTTLSRLYLETGDHENALRHVHELLAAGHPVAALREGLERAGHWREPAPLQDEAVSAEAATP